MNPDDDKTTPSVRTQQTFIQVTYVWVGNEYKGMYFFDHTEGYFRLTAPWDCDVYDNEQQCMNKLLRGNLWKSE